MTKPHHTAFVTGVLLVSVVGALALGGSAAALEPDRSSPYPDTVGSSANTPVAIFAEEGDAIVDEGLASLAFNYGVDGNFDGSLANVTDGDVSVLVAREQEGGGRTVTTRLDAIEVSTEDTGDRLVAEFDRTLDIEAGDRIVALIDNFSTPTEAGDYTVDVTATTPSDTQDGPVGVSYAADRATLEFENQTASQFGPQNVSITGVVPSYGYVAVFRSDNGTRGELLGSTEVIPSFDSQNYTVSLDGAVTDAEEVVAISYYETTGDTLSARRGEQFDPETDEPFQNNGVMVNATGVVSVIDADGRVGAGSSYEQGARLFFDQGDAETAYAIQTVAEGEPRETARQFETDANATALINTTGLDAGQYTIVRLSDGSVLSLDDDDTTSAADDSFQLTGASASGSTDASGATDDANASGDANATDDSVGGVGNESADSTTQTGADGETELTATDTTSTDGSEDATTGSGDSDGNGGGSNFPGPGFGIGVTLVAVLAVALLVARRRP